MTRSAPLLLLIARRLRREDQVVLLGPPRPGLLRRRSGHEDDGPLAPHLDQLGLARRAGERTDEPAERPPGLAAGRAPDHHHRHAVAGLLRPVRHADDEPGAGHVLDDRDDLGPRQLRGGSQAQRLVGELGAQVFEHLPQRGLVEHPVGRRLLPGIGVRIESGELEVHDQIILRDVACQRRGVGRGGRGRRFLGRGGLGRGRGREGKDEDPRAAEREGGARISGRTSHEAVLSRRDAVPVREPS